MSGRHINVSGQTGEEIFTQGNPGHVAGTVNTVLTGSNVPDGWENPFNTAQGQKAASIAETWEARLSRLGLVNFAAVTSPQSTTAGTGKVIVNRAVSEGNVVMPLYISISASGPGLAYISFKRFPGDSDNFITHYLPTSGTFEFKPEGIIRAVGGTGVTITLNFRPDEADIVVYGSMAWTSEVV